MPATASLTLRLAMNLAAVGVSGTFGSPFLGSASTVGNRDSGANVIFCDLHSAYIGENIGLAVASYSAK